MLYVFTLTKYRMFLHWNRSKEEWRNIAQRYETLWKFPNCFNAIDKNGDLVGVLLNSSTEFLIYKRSFSVVLLAIVDAKYISHFSISDAMKACGCFR